MPIPAGAGIIASAVYATDGAAIFDWWLAAVWMALVTFIGFLMVSRWRFLSLKGLDLQMRRPFRAFFFIAGTATVIVLFSHEALPILAFGYMISGIFSRASYLVTRRRAAAGTDSSLQQSTGEQQNPESRPGMA